MKRNVTLILLGLSLLILSWCVMSTNNKNNNWNNANTNTTNLSWSNTAWKTVVNSWDTVKVDYIGKLENGTLFDTSIAEEAKKAWTWVYNPMRPYQPLEFTVGAGQMIPWFDKGVVGMKLGETKSIKVEPKDWYGEYDPSRLEEVKKSDLKAYEDAGIVLKAWTILPTRYWNFKISSISGDIVKVDTNHELAGKVLIFDVTIKDIK